MGIYGNFGCVIKCNIGNSVNAAACRFGIRYEYCSLYLLPLASATAWTLLSAASALASAADNLCSSFWISLERDSH
jgi:hypothetical protein